MNDPRDWESHDETLSALYRTTQDVEPPAWLDERILTAAHTAAASQQSTPAIPRSRRYRVRFWMMPVALAATVIMTVGIIRLARETGEWNPPMEMETKARSVAEPSAETDAVSPGRRESASAKQGLSSALSSPAPVPPAASANRIMEITPSSAAPPMPKPRSLAPEERRRSDRRQTAPVLQDEDAGNQRQQDDRSPEEWLADIDELRRQGRIAEAKASLAKFRRRYPDYPQVIWEGTD